MQHRPYWEPVRGAAVGIKYEAKVCGPHATTNGAAAISCCDRVKYKVFCVKHKEKVQPPKVLLGSNESTVALPAQQTLVLKVEKIRRETIPLQVCRGGGRRTKRREERDERKECKV